MLLVTLLHASSNNRKSLMRCIYLWCRYMNRIQHTCLIEMCLVTRKLENYFKVARNCTSWHSVCFPCYRSINMMKELTWVPKLKKRIGGTVAMESDCPSLNNPETWNSSSMWTNTPKHVPQNWVCTNGCLGYRFQNQYFFFVSIWTKTHTLWLKSGKVSQNVS